MGWSLFLRGMWWRRGFTAAVLLVATISAAVAAIGPLYARAATESTLADVLRDAGSRTGLSFTFVASSADVGAVLAGGDAARSAASRVHGYGAPIAGRSLVVTAKTPGESTTTPSTMAWRSGQCAAVVLVTGRCPQRRGEAMVPANAQFVTKDWTVGHDLTVHQGLLDKFGVLDGPQVGTVRIVGTYRAQDTAAPYWFGRTLFVSQFGPAVTSGLAVGVDAVFVSADQFADVPPEVPFYLDLDVPLLASQIRLADVARLRHEVAVLQGGFPVGTANGGTTPGLRTDLAAVLATADRNKRQVQDATLVVVLELAALSLLVLFQVVGGAVQARGDEIALAKLRGLRSWRTVLFALSEPTTVLVVAAPLGLLSALGVTKLLASTALVHGTPVRLTAATGWALAAAFAGSALAAVAAAGRTMTRPVLEQWRNTAPPQHGRRVLLVLDLALAAAAAATAVALRLGRHDRPGAVFLLAPALIVFAVALLGARLLPRLGRLGMPRTRASWSVASFLALRQTVRRPGGLRLAALLAVAAGLATFAVCGEAVATANRSARAQTELGAPRRLAVQFDAGHDPQTIVDAVDPKGAWAMASATWSPDGGGSNEATITGPVLGVESSRLTSTSYRVRGQLPPAQLARSVNAGVGTPARFTGTQLRATITAVDITGDPNPSVEFGVRREHERPASIAAGPLRVGTHDYTVAVDCAAGCSFTGVTVDRSIAATDLVTGSITLRTLVAVEGGTTRPVPAVLTAASAWRVGQIGFNATGTVTADATGVRLRYRATAGSSPILAYVDAPLELPLVAAPGAATERASTGTLSDFSGAVAPYRVAHWASPLPAVLDGGAITDLDYLRLALPRVDRESVWSVWIGPHAPADAVARLQSRGLLVEHVTTERARVAELGRQGPALGLLLLLVCAVAAAVLAIGGTAVALLSEGRRRSFELAALRMVGVPQRTLRRSAVTEQAALLGAALVLGVPSGFVAGLVVLPVVPEFSDATPVVLRYTPSVLVALACALAFAAILWVTALVAGRALARSAVPARLREAGR